MQNEGAMRSAIIAATIILTAIAGILFSCSQPTGNQYIRFRVKVDSLQVPDPLSHEDTLNIRLHGVIGTDLCHSFSHFHADRDTFRLRLTVFGKLPADLTVGCPEAVAYLDTTYSVCPLYPGLFHIEIQQPVGILRDSVVVW